MNPTQIPDRSARLNMRISPDALESIREAASAQQQDVTSFVLGAAMEQALLDQHRARPLHCRAAHEGRDVLLLGTCGFADGLERVGRDPHVQARGTVRGLGGVHGLPPYGYCMYRVRTGSTWIGEGCA